MKTYVASVEATLVAQQFASEGGAAAHWAQVTKFEESIRDPAAIRLKTEVPTESADKIAFTDATSAALAQDNIVRPLDVQLKNANGEFKLFQTYFQLHGGFLIIDSSTQTSLTQLNKLQLML